MNHIQLEAASNSAKPITEVTALLRHAPLWNDVREILGRARVPSQISMEESSTVVRALLGLLLTKNWQRPSAAAGATFEEFKNIEEVCEQGTVVVVMWVVRHKTARQGPVKLDHDKR